MRTTAAAAAHPYTGPMRLFWVGFVLGVAVFWIRDEFGPGWSLLIGTPIAVLIARWVNGPIPLPDEEA